MQELIATLGLIFQALAYGAALLALGAMVWCMLDDLFSMFGWAHEDDEQN